MLFGAAALTLQLVAIQDIQISTFEAVKRSTGIFLSAIFGLILSKEKIDKLQGLGLIIMAIGPGLASVF